MTEGNESDGSAVDRSSTSITSNISKGQLFGPFSNPLHWLSFKLSENSTNDSNASNALFGRIEIARHSSEQNLKVVHRNGNFYFKAICNITFEDTDVNNETPKLYAWFGRELEARLPTASSSCINGSTRYFCPLCNEVFLYSNSVVTHILCKCPKRIQIDSIPVTNHSDVKPTNSGSTPAMTETVGNGSAAPVVKTQMRRKRGFDIASLVKEESNEEFPNKVNKITSETDKCDKSPSFSTSAFHRPKSPTVRKANPIPTTSTTIDSNSVPIMSSAFKKVDHKMSSIANPYDFSALYQRVATTSLLPSVTASVCHPMMPQMPLASHMSSSLPTSLSGTNAKSLVSNTLLPYLPPSLAALTFPTTNWCAKCNATFRMTSDLVYHMRSHHKNLHIGDTMKKKREEKLRCNICNETFRERHHLTRHMTSHQ